MLPLVDLHCGLMLQLIVLRVYFIHECSVAVLLNFAKPAVAADWQWIHSLAAASSINHIRLWRKQDCEVIHMPHGLPAWRCSFLAPARLALDSQLAQVKSQVKLAV